MNYCFYMTHRFKLSYYALVSCIHTLADNLSSKTSVIWKTSQHFLIPTLVFRGTVVSREMRGELARIGVRVQDVWRNKGSIAQRYLPSQVRRNQGPVIPIWVPLTKKLKAPHTACIYPHLINGQSYLFISQAYEVSLKSTKNK